MNFVYKSGREKFKKFEGIINICVILVKILPKSYCKGLLVFFRGIRGKKGLLIRYILLRNVCEHCGSNVSVYENVYIIDPHCLSLGNNVSIHPMCYLDAAGGLKIGNNVSIAHNTSILTPNHTWLNNDMPIKYNSMELKEIIICNDVWISCGCRIMPGVTIESRSIIAAGAVVTKDVPNNTIVAGIPARSIKKI